MELIKNRDAGKWVMEKGKFCKKCANEGRLKIVQECDREKFDELFDKIDARGGTSNAEVYEMAIEQCRYDYYYCPDCEKGQIFKDEYPMYEG